MLKIMKKSKLRNIIKESIKELMNEQLNLTGLPIGAKKCEGGPQGSSSQRFLVQEPNGTIRNPQVGDVYCEETVSSGDVNWNNYTTYGCRIKIAKIANWCDGCDYSQLSPNGTFSDEAMAQMSGCSGGCAKAPVVRRLIDGCGDESCPDSATATAQGSCGQPAPPACAEITAQDCNNPAMSMIQPCVTIDGQIPDQSYVNTAIAANNTTYLINSVSPSTNAPYGTMDFPQTGVQGCPGQGTFGIATGGAGFNYPTGWDAGNWTNNFVNMILSHPNPCNFLNTQLNTFLNTLFAGVTTGQVGFDINGNTTPPVSDLIPGVLHANLLMQKIVVIYELLMMTGCIGGSLEEQRVDRSSIKNIKMDPKAKDVLRKSADKLKGLANKKANPAVDRMQKLANIPTDRLMNKPRK